MTFGRGAFGLAALSLTALGFTVVPSGAFAQEPTANADTTQNDTLNKPINLDVRQ